MKSYNIFVTNVLPKIKSFIDFYKITKEYKNKQTGDFFEIITKYVFLLHNYYRNITKKIWLYDEMPYELIKELGIPEKDKGIDLVLLTQDNKYYAIQCKFRNNVDIVIPWGELGTFVGMSFGISCKFSGAFLVTNTTYIDTEISKCDRIIKIYGDFFDTLDYHFFSKVNNYINQTKANYRKCRQKRDYQEIFISKCIEYFKTNNRGYGNIACGIGKTLMSYWVHKTLNPRITLIAVPSLYLLTQFFKEWIFEAEADNYNPEVLLIGSNADYETDKYMNNGLLLTTDDIEIYKKLAFFTRTNNRNLIIITTYQSADKLIFASDVLKLKYDLAIIDEAHKTCQQDGHQFSLLLNDKNIKIVKRLFLTATPRIYRITSKDDGEDNDIVSMNNEKWYGNEIYRYSIRQGIDAGYLCPYQILTLFTDNAYIDNLIKENILVNCPLLKESNSYYVACAIMIIKSIMENDCSHMVTYHNSISNSKLLSNILETLFPHFKLKVQVYQLDGKSSIIKRNKIIKLFLEHEKSILVTARVLNEGVNIPIIDSVCFVDQRESTIDITQCVGRSLRLYDGKKMAKVLIPYVFDDINNIEDNTYINKMASIIKALYDSDEVIREYFKLDRNGKTINGLIKHKCYFNDDINVVKSEKINLNKWIDELEIGIWKRVDSFEYMYNKLVKWIDDHKKIPSTHSKDNEEKKLGIFCSHARQDKKNGKFKQDKIDKLNKIKEWVWSSDETQVKKTFDERYNELVIWVENNGSIPSENLKDETEKSLSLFCRRKRQDKRNGKLEQDEIDKLNKIEGWFWDKIDEFDEYYDKLVKWINNNKKLPNANSEDEIEKKLGIFCMSRRQDKRNGKLKQYKIDKLNKIEGWYWDKVDAFEIKYDELVRWVNDNKRIPSDKSNDETERKLGKFCNHKRQSKKNGKLEKAKIDKLEKINGWYWSAVSETRIVKTFDEHYNELIKWINLNNKFPSEKSDDDTEKKLGKFCSHKRQDKKKGKLEKDKIDKLEKINGWYWEKN